MASIIFLVLVFLSPALSLPFAVPEYTPEVQVGQGHAVTNSAPQIQSGVQEKPGVPVSSGCLSGFSTQLNQEDVVRVQNAPINVEQVPSFHNEPVFLPPQSIPLTQVDQIVRPVIVPAEAIASGRVIIMAVEPVQQRAFPDVVIMPQQSIVSETPVQQVQAVEKQTAYQESVQANSNTEQQNVINTAQGNFNEVPQRHGQVQPETTQIQVYPAQQAVKQVSQPIVPVRTVQDQVAQQSEYVEKQAQSNAEYTPVTQAVESVQQVQVVASVQQEHLVQPKVETQQENVLRVETVPHQQEFTTGTVPENVQKPDECATAQKQYELQQRVDVQKAGEQVQQAEVHQQQTYGVQPEQVIQQVHSVEYQQEVQQQIPEVDNRVIRTEDQQGENVAQQVNTYSSGQIYNFGDKIPQHLVETVTHQQQQVVQPIVVGN